MTIAQSKSSYWGKYEPLDELNSEKCYANNNSHESSMRQGECSFERPGISPESLVHCGVRHLDSKCANELCGIESPGLYIPYFNYNGEKIVDDGLCFARLRLDEVIGNKKYHQRYGSSVYPYIPLMLKDIDDGNYLVVVEGEFKAISLCEAGISAVGISGFYGFCRKSGEAEYSMLPELQLVINERKPKIIYFLGDSDTALNVQFSIAVARLSKLIPTIELRLPRIPLDMPKGIDDCREILRDDFSKFLNDILSESILVDLNANSADLSAAMLERESVSLISGNHCGFTREKLEQRFIEILAMHHNSILACSRIHKVATVVLDCGKRELSNAVQSHLDKLNAKSNDDICPVTEDPDYYSDVMNQFGPMLINYTIKRNGDISYQLGQPFWAALMSHENSFLYNKVEREFYLYDESDGRWKPVSEERIQQLISERILKESNRGGEFELLAEKRGISMLNNVTAQLKGIVEIEDAFKVKRPFIHCNNQMIDFSSGEPVGCEFSKDFYSRNALAVKFNPDSECPRFLNELINPALPDPDDISLLQRWFGMSILQDNICQRFLILTGNPNTGKSQLAVLARLLVDDVNTGALRTNQLAERFELYRVRRKTLLQGADVPGDFLMQKSAPYLKSLVGGDPLEAEGKNLNTSVTLQGRFNVLITCNERLRILIEGDAGAWRRRLLILDFNGQKPKKRIPNFAEYLYKEEGEGILNWAIQGAVDLLREVDESGDFKLSEEQHRRIDNLLSESESLNRFCKDLIQRRAESSISKEELIQSYGEYCAERGWEPWPLNRVQKKLPELMLQCHRVPQARSLKRAGKSVQGYNNVGFVEVQDV